MGGTTAGRRAVSNRAIQHPQSSGTAKKNYSSYCQGGAGAKCESHNRVKPAPSSIPARSRPIIAATFHSVVFRTAPLFAEKFADNALRSETELVVIFEVSDISGCTNRQ
jgi:hypothetical protein